MLLVAATTYSQADSLPGYHWKTVDGPYERNANGSVNMILRMHQEKCYCSDPESHWQPSLPVITDTIPTPAKPIKKKRKGLFAMLGNNINSNYLAKAKRHSRLQPIQDSVPTVAYIR